MFCNNYSFHADTLWTIIVNSFLIEEWEYRMLMLKMPSRLHSPSTAPPLLQIILKFASSGLAGGLFQWRQAVIAQALAMGTITIDVAPWPERSDINYSEGSIDRYICQPAVKYVSRSSGSFLGGTSTILNSISIKSMHYSVTVYKLKFIRKTITSNY